MVPLRTSLLHEIAKTRHSGPVKSQHPVRWDHNIHYHRRILASIQDGALTALDVGTGNGLLAAEMRTRVPFVVGIDSDATVLETARAEERSVAWVLGDIMNYPFPPDSFDVVSSVATLHHLPDLGRALERLAELTAPGGVLAVVGLARSSTPRDAMYDAAGIAVHHWNARRLGLWQHSAPTVWPPPHTYEDVRRCASRALPGVTWTRLALWRYLLVWHKPLG